jgi:hypothetical protein
LTYYASDSFDVVVTFDKNVIIAGGSPELALTFETTAAGPKAVYDSGSTTNSITFRYSVISGNEDTNGVDVAASIALAGATLKDTNGNDAYLILSSTNFPLSFIDAIQPTVTIAATSVITNSNFTTYAMSGTCSENTQAVNVNIGGVTDSATCTALAWSTSTDVTAATESADNTVADVAITADHSDAGANAAIQATDTQIKDTVIPTISFDALADVNLLSSTNYTVSGTCADNTQTITLYFGALTTTTTCTSTTWSKTAWDISAQADNAIVAVTADISDAVGNAATQITVNVAKDTSAPAVAITTPADASQITGATDSATFTVSGTCDENTETVTIKVDGTAASSSVGFVCDGTNFTGTIDTTGLSFASHAFTAELSDSSGNTGVSTTNNVSKINYLVGFTSSPIINLANETNYIVTGTCSVDTETVTVTVDGSLTNSPTCTGGTFTTATFDVSSATDGASVSIAIDHGDANDTTTVIMDTIAPTITLDALADVNTSNETNYTVSGTCDEDTETVTLYFGALTTTVTCATTTWSKTAWDISAQADNAIVAVTADITDTAGNPATQATINVAKDTSAPTVALTTPANSSYINIANDNASFAIAGTCDDATATYDLQIDASSVAALTCDGTNLSGTFNSTSQSEAILSFTIVATDATSNSATSSANSVTKDTTTPTSAITVSADVNIANASAYTVSGTCTEDGSVDLGFGALTTTATCSAGTWSKTGWNVSAQSDGASISITADMTDTAGNPATQTSTTIAKDATAPVVAITYSPDITGANENGYSISGTCTENSVAVNIDIDGLTYTPTCSGGSWTIGSQNVSSRTDNAALPITADQTDAAGNPATQATTTVDKTTSVPTVSISSSPDMTQANLTSYVVSGACSENGLIVTVDIGGISKSPNCTSGTWNTGDVDVTALTDGTITITADHPSATQATATVDKDTTSATVTISSASNITPANELTYIASGTCSENAVNVDVYVDSLNYLVSCSSGTWTTGMVDVSSLSDGTGLLVTADHSTATQASQSINKETSTPTVSALSVSSTLSDSADLSWSMNNPGGFTIDDYTVNYRVKGSPTWLSFTDGVSTATTMTVNTLTDNTTYEFRILVDYDSIEQSPWSNTTEGTTQPDSPLFGPNTAMNVGGSTTTTVVAYQNSTAVTLNGAALTTLNAGDTHTFVSAAFDVIDADKPIFTAGRRGSGANTSKGNIVWQPTAWAGKNFNLNATRETTQYLRVYAIEATTIEVKQGATVLASATIAKDATSTLSWTTFGSYQVISTGSVLAFHNSGTVSRIVDPKPLLPSANEVIGFPSNSMTLTTSSDGTNYNGIHSNSVTESGSLNKSENDVISPEGATSSLFQGESLIISADKKIAGTSYADSNGNCAAPFMPTNLMRTTYALPVTADFVAFASKASGTIAVKNSSGTLVTTLTLSRSGGNSSAPYKVRTTTIGAGYTYVATVPVAAWYQPDTDTGASDQDETIMYGTNE